MIDIQMRGGILCSWQKWFYAAPLPADGLKAVQYLQSRAQVALPGFVREPFPTRLLDLRKGADAVLQCYAKNTRYEIRRARAEGVSFELESDLAKFLDFYNSFATTKGLSTLDFRFAEVYAPFMKMTKAVRDGIVLTMHSYLVDEEQQRARLLHSASGFRSARNAEDAQLFGRANRLLHHEDMVYFLDHDMRDLDLGGHYYGCDPELINVNKFKESFGGRIVEESNYLSLPLFIRRLLRKRLTGAKRSDS